MASAGCGRSKVSPVMPPPPEAREKALSQLNDFLLNLASDPQSDAAQKTAKLREALQKVPHLVHLESDPVIFRKWDRDTFPQRLADYWNLRCRLFDKPFLPLSLTGAGALTPDDVKAYRLGTLHILPQPCCVHSVLWLHQPNLQLLPPAQRRRLLFYAMHISMHQPSIGTLILGILSDKKAFHEVVDVVRTFPPPLRVLQLFPTNEFGPVDPQFEPQGPRSYLYRDLVQPSDQIQKLLSLGFKDFQVPSVLGGKWTLHELSKWMADRQELEYEMYPSLHVDDTDHDSSRGVACMIRRHSSEATTTTTTTTIDRKLAPIATPMTTTTTADNTMSSFDHAYAAIGLDKPRKILETKAFVNEKLDELQAALRNTPEPRVYQIAQATAPLVFDKESKPLHFLRSTDFCVKEAAVKLAQYWQLRKKLFGERFMLPMTQTGDGALSEDDLLTLGSGSVSVLPDDADGRSVFLTDRNRTLGSVAVEVESKMRCFFYLMQVVASNPSSQSDGFVFVGVLVTPRVMEFYNGFAEIVLKVQVSMPARLKAFHMLVLPPKVGKKDVIERIVSAAEQLARKYHDNRVLIHSATSSEEMFAQLQRFGLQHLPSIAGGTWKYEDFTKWAKRKRVAESQQLVVGQRELETTSTKRDDTAKGGEDTVDRKERKRKLNIIHSRQKRERRRAEMEQLQAECSLLRKKNAELKQENTSLETLLQDATRKISEIEGSSIDALMALKHQTVVTPATTVPPQVAIPNQGPTIFSQVQQPSRTTASFPITSQATGLPGMNQIVASQLGLASESTGRLGESTGGLARLNQIVANPGAAHGLTRNLVGSLPGLGLQTFMNLQSSILPPSAIQHLLRNPQLLQQTMSSTVIGDTQPQNLSQSVPIGRRTQVLSDEQLKQLIMLLQRNSGHV